MKMFLLVSVLLAFVMNVFGDGDWKLVSITDNPPSVVSDNSPKLASLQSDGLPLRLPIGSTSTIRDYIVASNGLAMNVIVGLGVYTPKTKELTNGRWSFGYGSYEQMLEDSRKIMEQAVAYFKTNDFSADTMVYSILIVTYFNDEMGTLDRDRITLNMINPCSTFGTLTADKAMAVIGIDAPSYKEQVIVPVPKLRRAEYTVDISSTEQAKLVWTKETGPQLANWKSPKDSTVQNYVYLRSWAADGSVRSRFTLETLTGERVTYTQFGVRLKSPEFSIRKGEVGVTVARGSDTYIATSQDMKDWQVVQSISSTQSGNPGSDYQSFKFLVPMNQSYLIISGGSY
jgi:hypothetical protein